MIELSERLRVKKAIHSQGKTLREWATEHGFKVINVYRFFDGTLKGRGGESHRIAVASGLKTPEAV